VDPTRRGFLKGAFLTAEGRQATDLPRGPGLPWPAGSAPDAARCAACEEAPCAAACDPAIVRRHEPEHRLQGLPWLDFTQGGCTLCAECLLACPEAPPALDLAALPALGLARIDADRCIAHQGVICLSCQTACPTRAIQGDFVSLPRVDPARCNGCGACVAPCPGHALTVIMANAPAHD